MLAVRSMTILPVFAGVPISQKGQVFACNNWNSRQEDGEGPAKNRRITGKAKRKV